MNYELFFGIRCFFNLKTEKIGEYFVFSQNFSTIHNS
jgi:hypothetical protein